MLGSAQGYAPPRPKRSPFPSRLHSSVRVGLLLCFRSPRSSSCSKCTAGFFAPRRAMAACDKCPMAQYADQTGASACQMCPDGSNNAITEWLQYTGTHEYSRVLTLSQTKP